MKALHCIGLFCDQFLLLDLTKNNHINLIIKEGKIIFFNVYKPRNFIYLFFTSGIIFVFFLK
jgi:hypothetical protein